MEPEGKVPYNGLFPFASPPSFPSRKEIPGKDRRPTIGHSVSILRNPLFSAGLLCPLYNPHRHIRKHQCIHNISAGLRFFCSPLPFPGKEKEKQGNWNIISHYGGYGTGDSSSQDPRSISNPGLHFSIHSCPDALSVRAGSFTSSFQKEGPVKKAPSLEGRLIWHIRAEGDQPSILVPCSP